ncbi:Anthocyanidin 3-O-glucosyltransferase [Bertholletia excelsa]
MESSKLHAALLCSPGMGHLIPLLELGKRLVSDHGIQVTILVVTTHTSPAESQYLHPSNTSVNSNLLQVVELPPVDISGELAPGAAVLTQLCAMMRAAKPTVRSALFNMKPRPTMFVADIFGTESFDIVDEFRVPKYVFFTSTAWATALTVLSPVLDKEVVGQYVDLKEPLRLPGCKPVRPEDVVDPMLDRNNQQYREYLRIGIEFTVSDGILINTWEDLEPTSLKALREDDMLRSVVKAPVYPIGPFTKPVEPPGSARDGELLEWLAKQPGESVLYVSFGSGGTLSADQITELAWGLEMSQHKFIWVLRPPIEGQVDGSYFTSSSGPDENPDFLPDGFLTRTRDRGVVVPLWAQQMQILCHASVGGFLSHCGWNSTLESLINGVPMIAWPLYAEQRMNATMLTEELQVAVRTRELPTKKVVKREEVAEMVRRVMDDNKEAKALRERAKRLKISAKKALGKGGSSSNTLHKLIKGCQMRLDTDGEI